MFRCIWHSEGNWRHGQPFPRTGVRERDTRFKWSQKGGEGAEKYFWGRSKLNEEWRKSSGALGPWGGSRQVLTLLPHEICHLHPAPQPRVGQIQSHWSTAYIWTSTYIDLILLPLLFIVSVPLVRLNTQRRVQVSRLGITPLTLTLTPETSYPYWSVVPSIGIGKVVRTSCFFCLELDYIKRGNMDILLSIV